MQGGGGGGGGNEEEGWESVLKGCRQSEDSCAWNYLYLLGNPSNNLCTD